MIRKGRQIEVNEFEELQQLVVGLEKDSEFSVWLGRDYPCMNLLIKGNEAHASYFPAENHPGHISHGGEEIEGSMLINEKDQIEVPSSSIIPISVALESGKEFFDSKELPKNVLWLEL